MSDQMFNPDIVDEMSMYTPGCILWDDAGCAWMYVKVTETCGPNLVVMVQRNPSSAQLITTGRLNASTDEGSARMGIPRTTIPDDFYGWIQMYGPALVETDGAITNLEQYSYSTAEEGKLDDNSSGQHRTRNIIFWTAPNSAGTAECMLNWPGGVRYV